VPVLFFISHLTAIILFFITARYRLPVVPLLISFSSFAIFSFVRNMRDKKYRDVCAWGVIWVLSFAFVIFPWAGLNRTKDYAASYNNIGILLHMTGDLEGAIRYYQRAKDHDPSFAKPYNNLGSVYLQMGDKQKAMEAVNEGLVHNPDSARLHMKLYDKYVNEGDIKKAMIHFNVAAPQLPYSLKVKKIEEKLEL